jgi:predicted nucleic acid-binding Zn ribbon protein
MSIEKRQPRAFGDIGRPEPIADVLKGFLRASGLDARVERAQVLVEWASFVGPQIAGVTEPRTVTEDGTLFVGVKTHGWMTELSMMERSLLAKINARTGRDPIKKIRWELLRGG